MSIVAVSQELDPYVSPNLETAELSWLYADGLIGDDVSRPEGNSLCVRPPRAGAFGPSSSPSFEYELRPGIRWHDGKPLVAQDVRDCFERLVKSTLSHQRPFALVRRIEIVDDRRFTVHLVEPDPRFPLAFFTPFGSPGVPLVRQGTAPLGTGPMRVTSRTPDAALYERWPSSPRGVPSIAAARLRYVANADTQNVMLASGDTDVAFFVAHQDVQRRGIPYFKRKSGVVYLVVNVDGVLNAPQLRAAFAAAVDRDEIARKIYSGWSPPYRSVVAPPAIDVAGPHDPSFARTRLRTLTKPIELVGFADSQPILLLVQDQLRRIGIRSSIATYPVQQYLAPSGPLRAGKFDVALFGEYFSLDPDVEATWGCAAIPPAGGNFSRLCDRELDARAKSGHLPAALERLRADAAVVPLVRSVQCIGLSKRLRGAHDPPDLVSTVFQCAKWSLA